MNPETMAPPKAKVEVSLSDTGAWHRHYQDDLESFLEEVGVTPSNQDAHRSSPVLSWSRDGVYWGGVRVVPGPWVFPFETSRPFPRSWRRTEVVELSRLYVRPEFRLSFFRNWVDFAPLGRELLARTYPEARRFVVEAIEAHVSTYLALGFQVWGPAFTDPTVSRDGGRARLLVFPA